MRLILPAALGLLAILDVFLGLRFLAVPAATGADFGLAPQGVQGLSVLRADFTAFFLVAAASLAVGAWRRHAAALWPALGLFGIALSGRTLSVLSDGTYPGWWQPMAVEALHVALIVAAMRAFRSAGAR